LPFSSGKLFSQKLAARFFSGETFLAPKPQVVLATSRNEAAYTKLGLFRKIPAGLKCVTDYPK
jgi:hypothetical protein